MQPLYSIVIVTWNNQSDIIRCLESIYATSDSNFEIIVVDNNSEDRTIHLIKANYSSVRIIENEDNGGYSKAMNQGFDLAYGNIMIGLNPDTIIHEEFLSELWPAFTDDTVGIVAPRILNMEFPQFINSCGLEYTMTGLASCAAIDKPAESYNHRPIESISCFSGAAFAITRSCYNSTGGFDEDYFLYYEDVDLSWRAKLNGYKIKLAPSSIVYHKYQFQIDPTKLYWLERNRHVTLIKCLRTKSLFKLTPVLIIGELIIWVFAIWKGLEMVKAKFKAFKWVIENKESIEKVGNQTNDNVILKSMSTSINFSQVVPNVLGLLISKLCYPLLAINKWLAVSKT